MEIEEINTYNNYVPEINFDPIKMTIRTKLREQ